MSTRVCSVECIPFIPEYDSCQHSFKLRPQYNGFLGLRNGMTTAISAASAVFVGILFLP